MTESNIDMLIVELNEYILETYVPAKLMAPTLEVVFNDQRRQLVLDHSNGQLKCANLSFPFARSVVRSVPIKEAKNVVTLVDRNNETQSKEIIQMSLDTTNFSEIEYEPGDTIAILPKNSKEEVQDLLHALQLESVENHDCFLRLLPTCGKNKARLPPYIPEVTTPYEILRDCLNLRAVIKKQFLRALAEYCTIEKERDFLNGLSSKEGSTHYNALFLQKGLKLRDLLRICSSCRPPLALLIEHLPRLLPRPYSIANNAVLHKNEINIIFSILPHQPGVTTSMLKQIQTEMSEIESLESAPAVLMYFRESTNFRFTSEDAKSTDQILLTIGTGVAPFIGFLEQKSGVALARSESLGQTWLFVGAATECSLPCRDRLLSFKANGILDKYCESFSRIPDAKLPYIQDQIQANDLSFIEFFMRPSTVLYVCADGTHISKTIEKAICGCMARILDVDEMKASEMIKVFRTNGKYREDLWV